MEKEKRNNNNNNEPSEFHCGLRLTGVNLTHRLEGKLP